MASHRETPFLFLCQYRSYHANGAQDFLCKSDHQAAEQTEKALGALAGVVGLKAHAHLDNAPAQDDDAKGLDDGKDKVAQVIDNSQGVGAPGGEGRDGQHGAEGQDQDGGGVETAGTAVAAALLAGKGGVGVLRGFAEKVFFHGQDSSISSKISISFRDVKVKSRSPTS